MKYLIEVKVDMNDADYNSKMSYVSKEDIEKIKPLLKAVKKFNKDHPYEENYPKCNSGGNVEELYPDISEDVFDAFDRMLPYCEGGFHSIEKVIVREVEKETLLFE